MPPHPDRVRRNYTGPPFQEWADAALKALQSVRWNNPQGASDSTAAAVPHVPRRVL